MADSKKDDLLNPFRLEDFFSDPVSAFFPYGLKVSSDSDVVFALDTNTLLLPYSVKSNGISQLIAVYRELAGQKRFFLPARAAREFIVNRDSKLSETIKTMLDVKSRISAGENYSSPLFSGLAAHEKISAAQAKLSEAKAEYSKAISEAVDEIISWRGTDPITKLYAEIFTSLNIVENSSEKEELTKAWEWRKREKIPPGYKDATKDDGGIGDFLIWDSLLEIGRRTKSHLIFVSGEEKADWVVRSNNEPAYPRPELCEEYRIASDGKSFRLASLHQVLNELDAPKAIVAEFEKAEDEQFSAARLLTNYAVNTESKWTQALLGQIEEARKGIATRSFARATLMSYFKNLANGSAPEVSESYLFPQDGKIVNFGKQGSQVALRVSVPTGSDEVIFESVFGADQIRLFSSQASLAENLFALNNIEAGASTSVGIGESLAVENDEGQLVVLTIDDIIRWDRLARMKVRYSVIPSGVVTYLRSKDDLKVDPSISTILNLDKD